MKNYKLTLTYDGTRYKGYQRLQGKDNQLTIQGKIEDILSKMTGEEIQLIGCGRTDAGVHAFQYIANAHMSTDLSPSEIKNYINEYLPEDIYLKNIELVDDRFHARYNIKEKTYLYIINNNQEPNIFTRKYQYHLPEKLNIEKMIEASKYLIGTHDFSAYTNQKKTKKSTERTITDIKITENQGVIKIYITADGFLWNMVRLIVGALIDVGLEKENTHFTKKVLESKNRSLLSRTANPKALYMYNTKY